LLGDDDRADEVAKVLVLGHALRRSREDQVGHLGLATQQRDVSVVLGRAGAALPGQAFALGELATFELRACEAEQCVPPDRRPVLAELYLRFRELLDRRIETTGEPVDEADGVARPRRLGRIA